MRARLVAPLLVLAVLSGCRFGKKAQKPHQQPPTSVRVAVVETMNVPVTVTASGVVEALKTASVQAQVSGMLLAVGFQEGDNVDAGQVLFRIDARAFEAAVAQARSALARDEAQAVAARRSDARYQALVALDYVSREQADQVRAAALAAEATVAADRAVLRAAEVNLGYATIRAPISGRTGVLVSRVGDVVGPGSGPLVVINQIKPILVRFPVLSQDLPLLRAAATHPLPVTATVADSTGATEHGEFSFFDNAVDSTRGTVTAKARFANAAGRLWPGELVFLTVKVGTQAGALVVPTTAVVVGQQGSFVYVVDQQRRTAAVRTIVPGRTAGPLTAVTSGLRAGEWVVTDGQSQLKPGARVAIIGAPASARQAAGPTGTLRGAGITGGVWSAAGAPVGQGGAAGAPGAAVQPNIGGVPPAQPAPTTTTTGGATSVTPSPSPTTPGIRAPGATPTITGPATTTTTTSTTTTTTTGTRGGATGTSPTTTTGTRGGATGTSPTPGTTTRGGSTPSRGGTSP